MQVEIVNGVMSFPSFNSKLTEQEQAFAKAHIWLIMLNDRQKPTKWMSTTRSGTKIKFDFINSVEMYEEGLAELQVFLSEINERFNFNFALGDKKND